MNDHFPSEEEMASDPKQMARAISLIHAAQLDKSGRPLPDALATVQRSTAAWTGFAMGLVYGAWEIAKHLLHLP